MIINKEKLVFRRATLEDILILIKFKLLLLDELHEEENKDNLDQLKKELENFFTEYLPKKEFVSWLAEYDGEIIATAGLILWRMAPRYDCIRGRYGYILNVYTVPKFRKNGISTELLKRLIEDAKKLNIDILNLHATKEGINMYLKAGFKPPIDPELELNLEYF